MFNFDFDKTFWIYEPKQYEIKRIKLLLQQNQIRIFGKEPIMDSEMIMLLHY